jgi:hypothetical protein
MPPKSKCFQSSGAAATGDKELLWKHFAIPLQGSGSGGLMTGGGQDRSHAQRCIDGFVFSCGQGQTEVITRRLEEGTDVNSLDTEVVHASPNPGCYNP